jgi:hypothetical protein
MQIALFCGVGLLMSLLCLNFGLDLGLDLGANFFWSVR